MKPTSAHPNLLFRNVSTKHTTSVLDFWVVALLFWGLGQQKDKTGFFLPVCAALMLLGLKYFANSQAVTMHTHFRAENWLVSDSSPSSDFFLVSPLSCCHIKCFCNCSCDKIWFNSTAFRPDSKMCLQNTNRNYAKTDNLTDIINSSQVHGNLPSVQKSQ